MKASLFKFVRRSLFWIALCLVWEAAYRMGFLNPMVFSSPSLVYKAAMTDGPLFLNALKTTAAEIATAIVFAWGGGIVFGALAGAWRPLARVSSPLLSAMVALPIVILYPVLVTWFGIGPESKIVFGTLLGVFPIALNTMVGVQSIDKGYVAMARSLGASRFTIMSSVIMPLAFPTVISGLRLGTSLIVVGVILTEMLASTDGVGYLITYNRALFNTGDVVLGISLGLLLAFFANALLSRIEARYGRWRYLQQQAN